MDTVTVSHSLRERQAEFAAKFHLSLNEYLQIVKSCSATEVVVVLELMKAAKHRTSFRQQMHDRIRRWLDFGLPGRPLSEGQFKALMPRYPIRWQLPTR